MSLDELRWRLKEAARTFSERHGFKAGKSTQATTDQVAAELIENVKRLVPGANSQDLAKLQTSFPAAFDSLCSRTNSAREIASGRWRRLGFDFDLRKPPNWHKDPRSDFEWSREFYGDIKLSDLPNGVDVKYVWELGRHDYLVELGQAWLITRNDDYAIQARELLRSWFEEVPDLAGVHWTSALEVAIRSISWIWATALLAEWNGWTSNDLRMIADGLSTNAVYLSHHLSFFSSPYNHLMGEASGLYLVGLALAGDQRSVEWRETARSVLMSRGPGQFHSDGFTVEQATGYHFFTLGFLSLACAAARSSGESMGEFEESIHQAYRAALTFRQPDGRWPEIGDLDSARSIPIGAVDAWDFNSLIALGAVFFSDPALKTDDDPFHCGGELYWVLGLEAVQTWSELECTRLPAATIHEDAGYVIARGENDWLLFDAGPIAGGLHADATPSTAHGHSDALQILYCLDGRPLLIDSGMPFYAGPGDWVRYFRGQTSHNSIEIDGISPARHSGRLAWSHVSSRPELNLKLGLSAWLGRGRANWSGVTVERNFLCIPGEGLWIADYIETDLPRLARWYWHFPAKTFPAAGCERDGSDLEDERISFAMWRDDELLKFRESQLIEDQPATRRASSYGELTTCQRFSCELPVAGKALIATYLGRAASNSQTMEVRRDRCRTLCTMSVNHSDEISCVEPPQAHPANDEITWTLRTENGNTVYWCGRAIPEQTIDGAGNWHVSSIVTSSALDVPSK